MSPPETGSRAQNEAGNRDGVLASHVMLPEPARNSFRSNRGLDLPPMERKEQSSGQAKRQIFLLRCIFRLTSSNILDDRTRRPCTCTARECFLSVLGSETRDFSWGSRGEKCE